MIGFSSSEAPSNVTGGCYIYSDSSQQGVLSILPTQAGERAFFFVLDDLLL